MSTPETLSEKLTVTTPACCILGSGTTSTRAATGEVASCTVTLSVFSNVAAPSLICTRTEYDG